MSSREPLLENYTEDWLTVDDLEGRSAVQLKKLLTNPNLIVTIDEGLIESKRVRFRTYPPGLTAICAALPAELKRTTQRCHPFLELEPPSLDGPDLSDAVAVDVKVVLMEDAAETGKNGLLDHILSFSCRREFFEIDVVQSVTDAKWNTFYWKTRLRLIRFVTRVFLFESCIRFFARGLDASPREDPYVTCWTILTTLALLWSSVVDVVHLVRFALTDNVFSEEAQGGLFSHCILGTFYFYKHRCEELKKKNWFWAAFAFGLDNYVSIAVYIWLICVSIVRYALNLCVPVLSMFILYIIWTYPNSFSGNNKELTYWLITFFIIIGRLQVVRAFYFDLPKPSPFLMLTADFFHEIYSFGMLMFFIFSSYAVVMQLLYSATVEGSHQNEGYDICQGDPNLREHCKLSTSFVSLFLAMLGNPNPEAFDALPGSLKTLAYILLISFLIVQSIFMLNTLVSILSDGYDRTKANEKETLCYHRALYMRQMEREISPWIKKKIECVHRSPNFLGSWLRGDMRGYVYFMECKDENQKDTGWAGRIGAMKHYIQSATGTLSQDMEEKLMSLKAEQQVHVNRLNDKLSTFVTQHENQMTRQTHQLDGLHVSLKELERTMLAMMNELQSLKKQQTE